MSAVPGPSATQTISAVGAASRGIVLLVRGGLAVLLGLVITFSPDHSAVFGMIAFGSFALATALTLAIGHVLAARSGQRDALGLILVALAFAAGAASFLAPSESFVIVVSSWALLSGATELTAGILARRAGEPGRDSITWGALAVGLAAVLLIVPPEFTEPWQVVGQGGAVEAAGNVTADIMTVGSLGAWAIIHGVLVVIAALTPARGEVRA